MAPKPVGGPPATEVLDHLATRYGNAHELLMDGADAAMKGAWAEHGAAAITGSPAAWVDAAAPLMEGIQTTAASNAAAWVDVQAAAMGVDALPAVAAPLVETAPAALTSPVLRGQSLLAKGMDVADAVDTVSTYVSRLTTTATRAAEHAGRSQRTTQVQDAVAKAVAGTPSGQAADWDGYYAAMGVSAPKGQKKSLLWKRVPDSRACGWCRVVADQLYSEDGVKGKWHAFCRCTWRLATPEDAASIGQYGNSKWEDVIDQPAGTKAKPKAAEAEVPVPPPDLYDAPAGPALPDLSPEPLGPAVPAKPAYATPVYPGDASTLTPAAASEQVKGGVHTKQVLADENGDLWLFKPQEEHRTHLDVAANEIARRGGLDAPETYMATVGGKSGSLQKMYGTSSTRRNAFGTGEFNPSKLTPKDLETLQQHEALDWMIGNHDAHSQQWVRVGFANQGAPVIGVDKGQAFKYAGADKKDWKYHPNKVHGAPEPVYNLMAKGHVEGTVNLPMLHVKGNPAKGMRGTIDNLQGIPDDEYRALLRPYAESAAKAKQLAKGTDLAGDVEGFLDHAVARKNGLSDEMEAYHTLVQNQRNRYARKVAGPKPAKVLPGDLVDRPGAPKGHFKEYVDPSEAHLRISTAPAVHKPGAKVYTGGSYGPINRGLRGQTLPAGYENTVRALDASMVAPKKPLTVVRGTNLPGRWGQDPGSLVGKVIWDDGYTSSSVGTKAAFGGGQYLHIALHPDNALGVWAKPFSFHPGENEVILARGTHMLVHGARRDGHAWILDTEVVSKEWAEAAGVLAPKPL